MDRGQQETDLPRSGPGRGKRHPSHDNANTPRHHPVFRRERFGAASRKVFAERATQSTFEPCLTVGLVIWTYRELQGLWKTTPKICGKQGKNSACLETPALSGWQRPNRVPRWSGADGVNGITASEAKRDSSLRRPTLSQERKRRRNRPAPFGMTVDYSRAHTRREQFRPGGRGGRGRWLSSCPDSFRRNSSLRRPFLRR